MKEVLENVFIKDYQTIDKDRPWISLTLVDKYGKERDVTISQKLFANVEQAVVHELLFILSTSTKDGKTRDGSPTRFTNTYVNQVYVLIAKKEF